MKAFHSGREAKEFLISKIVAQAQSENAPLSEVERKMLYYTESGWTLPDIMEVNEEFDREHDQDKYEQKITKLVAKAYKRICKGPRNEYDQWWAAIHFLQKEDHYILVMVQLARLRPRRDQFRLFITGLAIASLLLMWGFISAKYNISMPISSREFLWVVVVALFVAYMVLRFSPWKQESR